MASKTPAAPVVWMAAYTRAIWNGMTMMNETSYDGMSGIESDMPAHRQMMEKRSETTPVAMQSAIDRLTTAPPK